MRNFGRQEQQKSSPQKRITRRKRSRGLSIRFTLEDQLNFLPGLEQSRISSVKIRNENEIFQLPHFISGESEEIFGISQGSSLTSEGLTNELLDIDSGCSSDSTDVSHDGKHNNSATQFTQSNLLKGLTASLASSRRRGFMSTISISNEPKKDTEKAHRTRTSIVDIDLESFISSWDLDSDDEHGYELNENSEEDSSEFELSEHLKSELQGKVSKTKTGNKREVASAYLEGLSQNQKKQFKRQLSSVLTSRERKNVLSFFKNLEVKNEKLCAPFGHSMCPACTKEVFLAEQSPMIRVNKSYAENSSTNPQGEIDLVWHKQCFRCSACEKKLHLRFRVDHEKLYCERCYIREILTLAGLETLACYTDKEGITYVDLKFPDKLRTLMASLLQLRIKYAIFTISDTLHPQVWHLKGQKGAKVVPENFDAEALEKIKVSLRDRKGVTSEIFYSKFISSLVSFTPSLGFTTLKFYKNGRFHEKFVCFLWLPESSDKVSKVLYGCAVGNIRRKVNGISEVFTFRNKEDFLFEKVLGRFKTFN